MLTSPSKLRTLALAGALLTALAHTRPAAADDCRCVSIAADITGVAQADVIKADGLYARGEFAAALALYARAHGTVKAAALLYAQGMAQARLGATAEARGLLEAYLAASGTLAYRAQAEAELRALGGGVTGAVASTVGGAGRLGGDLVGGVAGGARGGVDGTVGGVGGAVTGVSGELRGRLSGAPKPPKVAKGAAVLLGVVAVAAVGAVGIHGIAAGLKDDIELDAKFDLGLGLTGVTVGITAIYLYGLTAAAGTVGSVKCATRPTGRPMIAPMALPGGGGLATAFTF